MDQLHLMKVFVAVAEEGGFAPASRRLNMSPPAVTRAVAALESELGVMLFTRTTRIVKTTDAGSRYLEDARRIIQDIELANEAVIGINSEPKGLLSVTAPVLFGQRYIVPGLVEYLNRYPQTQVEAIFLDRVVNLLEEGFDVGIRIGVLPDSSMRAKKVGHVRVLLVASPDYLSQRGIPQNLDDLKNHTLISSQSGSMSHDWKFDLKGRKTAFHIHPRLMVSTNQAAINAALESFGITRVISYQVADELKAGRLKVVLENYELPRIPIHIVHRESRLSSSKVRSFIDLMAQRLSNELSLT
ncbi:LysR family transcriptional regulator [Marinobacter sp. CHS3-4]|uniref:LysR family transcriptional regulator n=1 Tax=Marinobacter sp. CHS3-4 TaxID=3045174 RepID=UPI0024B58C11|nr:LysR family transcriptional regulator [Marinobacter sp. CHS3-4]MDI9245338.1 LysR family transcriptional regulator [Marinobacter sp. CHS3-4]